MKSFLMGVNHMKILVKAPLNQLTKKYNKEKSRQKYYIK